MTTKPNGTQGIIGWRKLGFGIFVVACATGLCAFGRLNGLEWGGTVSLTYIAFGWANRAEHKGIDPGEILKAVKKLMGQGE